MSKKIDDILRPKIGHVNVPLKYTMFTYGQVLEEFYKFIFNTDLKGLGLDFKKVIINSQLPIRNRLIRTRAEQLGVSRPVLSVNGSIYTEDVGNGMYPGEYFNTDMSNVCNAINYSDSIVYNKDAINNNELLFNVVSKEGALNVEFGIIDDTSLKVESYREHWLRMKFKDWMYGCTIPIRYIIPAESVLVLCYKLGLITDFVDISKSTYEDICKLLFPYITPGYTPKIMRDKIRGTTELVIEYPYDMVYKCEIVDMRGGEQRGFIDKNFVLTRSFMLKFPMPASYLIDTQTTIPQSVLDEFIGKQKDVIKDTNIVSTPVVQVNGDTSAAPYGGYDVGVKKDSEYYKQNHPGPDKESFTIATSKINQRVKIPNTLDKYTLLIHAYYTHTSKDDRVINCRNLISGDILGFYNRIKELKLSVFDFFKVVYYDETTLKNPQLYNIDYDTFTLYDNDVKVNKESLVCIYIDSKELRDYLTGVWDNIK